VEDGAFNRYFVAFVGAFGDLGLPPLHPGAEAFGELGDGWINQQQGDVIDQRRGSSSRSSDQRWKGR
jgi:hypothetical protein